MGYGLRVAQRCRSAQAGDVAYLARASESGDQAVLLGSSCRFRLCFVVPAVSDIATWRKPQNMLVQTNRAVGGRGCASGFGCLPSTPLSPVQ